MKNHDYGFAAQDREAEQLAFDARLQDEHDECAGCGFPIIGEAFICKDAKLRCAYCAWAETMLAVDEQLCRDLGMRAPGEHRSDNDTVADRLAGARGASAVGWAMSDLGGKQS